MPIDIVDYVNSGAEEQVGELTPNSKFEYPRDVKTSDSFTVGLFAVAVALATTSV